MIPSSDIQMLWQGDFVGFILHPEYSTQVAGPHLSADADKPECMQRVFRNRIRISVFSSISLNFQREAGFSVGNNLQG